MKMYFDFRDVFKAPRLAFGFQRIWTNTLGILLAGITYCLFSYLAFIINGLTVMDIFIRHGFFPFPSDEHMGTLAWVVWGIGVILAGLILLITNTAVARLVYMQLRTEFFYSWQQAFRFSLKKSVSVIGAYFTFIFMIAFFVVSAVVMGFVGRIPAIGELINAFLTIPYIFAGLLLAFIVLVAVLSILLIPAILATMDEEALGGVFHSFSIVYNQPWRLAIYSSMVGILEILAFIFYAAMLKVGYLVFAALFEIGMGEKFYRIAESSLAWVQQLTEPIAGSVQALLGHWTTYIFFSHPHTAMALNGTESFAAGIMAFFLLLLGLSVVGYAEATGNAGLTLTFLVLYKKQEEENLLEREDDELREEEEESTGETAGTLNMDEHTQDKNQENDISSSAEGESNPSAEKD